VEIKVVIGAGLSASAFGNSVSMLIAVLGLSGHCNGYQATGPVICNSRGRRIVDQSRSYKGRHIVGQSYSCNSRITGPETRATIVGSATRDLATWRASLS
jgi:hypothetical protein